MPRHVIDLMPAETPFTLLEEAVALLRAAGFLVSVDSMDSGSCCAAPCRRGFPAEPERGNAVDRGEVASTPVLIPSTPTI